MGLAPVSCVGYGAEFFLPSGIEPLDARNATDVSRVCELHRNYLGDSPVVRLGDRFARWCYYGEFVLHGLIGCNVCRIAGGVVGFVSYTYDPHGFMMRGLRTHLWSVSKSILMELAARPRMTMDLLFLLRLMRQRRLDSEQPSSVGVGEILSLVVLPEFQNYFPGDGKHRVSVALVQSAITCFRKAGLTRFQLMVQPSNRAANVFWKLRGCVCERVQQGGVVVHRYIGAVK